MLPPDVMLTNSERCHPEGGLFWGKHGILPSDLKIFQGIRRLGKLSWRHGLMKLKFQDFLRRSLKNLG